MAGPAVQPEQLRVAAEKIVRVLQEAGHTAYFAGGCVRDMVMGRTPTDYDVATDARPERVRGLFRRTQLVGEAFGVVIVRLMRCPIEVATFRAEWGYADGRHPDHIEYTDAAHDARRRDFTINGLFYDPIDERLHDFVGGRADIDRGIIRAIGDADERFAEDYLRMLRAVRFAARLGFEIDGETKAAIERHAPKLAVISRERIGLEMRMMLELPTRAAAAGLVQEFALDAPVLDEPPARPPLDCLAALPDDSDYAAALAAWALDRHLPNVAAPPDAPMAVRLERLKAVRIARCWREALVLSNDDRDALRDALKILPELWGWTDLGVARQKRLLAQDDWPRLERLLRALDTSHGAGEFPWEDFQRDATSHRETAVAPEPLLSGDDLIAAGFTPGPAFKKVLAEVYDAQLEGRVSDQAAAGQLAREIMDEQSSMRGRLRRGG